MIRCNILKIDAKKNERNKSVSMKKNAQKAVRLAVKVIPRASKNQLVGWQNGELKVKLKAVPEKGKANQELIEFLADALGLSKSQIHLAAGATSQHKQLQFEGISQDQLDLLLQEKRLKIKPSPY